MCHVERGPSFPLATYEQVWLAKRKISAEVLARHMPPWAALPGYGRFANENVVTLRESQFIVSWMEGLGPRNAGKVFTNTAAQAGGPPSAAVQAHIDLNAWPLGQPDLTRDLEAVAVEPGRGDDADVVRTVLDPGAQLSTVRRVRAVEYIPGDRRVVRAAFFTVQETGQWIGSWTPWYGFMKLPDEATYQLPAGAHIVGRSSLSPHQRASDRSRAHRVVLRRARLGGAGVGFRRRGKKGQRRGRSQRTEQVARRDDALRGHGAAGPPSRCRARPGVDRGGGEASRRYRPTSCCLRRTSRSSGRRLTSSGTPCVFAVARSWR